MTLPELEAAVGWPERNRLSEQLHLLDGDLRYAWTARQRAEWKPPPGRVQRQPAERTEQDRAFIRRGPKARHEPLLKVVSEITCECPIKNVCYGKHLSTSRG